MVRRVVALCKVVAAVAVLVLRVVDLRGEVARHAVVVVRRVGVVVVVDEVLRRRVLLPDRLRSKRTPRPPAKSVVFRTHSPWRESFLTSPTWTAPVDSRNMRTPLGPLKRVFQGRSGSAGHARCCGVGSSSQPRNDES